MRSFMATGTEVEQEASRCPPLKRLQTNLVTRGWMMSTVGSLQGSLLGALKEAPFQGALKGRVQGF